MISRKLMMAHACLTLFVFLVSLPLLQAATKSTVQYGWQEIPGTTLKSVCPAKGYNGIDYNFSFYCQNVTAAWNGGAYDSKRNRLYIWGGGHTDYMGNEIYALDLDQNRMLRLTSPATPLANTMVGSNPSELMPENGTQPNSRHTYDAVAYLADDDRLWAFSGSLAPNGGTDSITWIFNPNDNKWKRVSPKGTLPRGNYGIVSAYNPNTGDVLLHDQHGLFSYHYTSQGGIYTRLVEDKDYGIHLSAEFDPSRHVFLMVGGGQVFVYDLSPGKSLQRMQLTTTGDNEIVDSQGPGLAYDPLLKQIVAWAGGNKVYMFDLDTKSWQATAYNGDPGPAICNGTFGRWAYTPKLNAFVTYNWYENNAFLLRIPHHTSAVRAIKTDVLERFNKDKKSPQARSQNNRFEQSTRISKVARQSSNTTSDIVVLQPSKDTFLTISRDSHGRQTDLQLSTNHRILAKFPALGVDKNTQIERATLRMYQVKSQPMSPIYTGIFLGTDDWKEDSTWDYRDPATKTKWLHAPGDWVDRSGIVQGGQPFDLQQVVVNPEGQWLEWEVTDLVRRWQAKNEAGEIGIVIKSLSGQEQPIHLMSRESKDTRLRPQLIIEKVQ
ncbi:MAG TPA: DNRLRE domain-containing protein [Crenotrichaceae bacterium]|nr:DNRLRE domain-containing protein [Crenotrichaceae bacterium]